jgi:hypothetical protein
MEDLPRPANLSALLEDARRRLVETGTRNRLIHVNRAAKRANALDVVGERSADVFDLLRAQGKRMRFLARDEAEGGETEEAGAEEPMLALGMDEAPDGVDQAARYRDLYLETRLGPEALQRRLLTLHTDARTAEEEQGVNILYLALGFLRWYEADSSQVLRESPLILMPVDLGLAPEPRDQGGGSVLQGRDGRGLQGDGGPHVRQRSPDRAVHPPGRQDLVRYGPDLLGCWSSGGAGLVRLD